MCIGVVLATYYSCLCGEDTDYFVLLLCTEGFVSMYSRCVLRVQGPCILARYLGCRDHAM